MNSSAAALLALSLTLWTAGAHAEVRARDLGIPLHGEPGALNAIADVSGVEVGHKTLIEGAGQLRVGTSPVRTGVTVVLPRGRHSTTPVFAGRSTLNAAGEMTGTAWVDERGLIDGPIAITNTHSVGVVRDAVIGWMVKRGWKAEWHAPVIAETYDAVLNEINGFHVRSEHVNGAAVLQFPNEDLTVLFEAAVGATEEAILNALVAARDMTGVDDIKIYALPHAEVRAMLNRKTKSK